MLTKTTSPITEWTGNEGAVIGTKVEYRLFGILLYKKKAFTPILKEVIGDNQVTIHIGKLIDRIEVTTPPSMSDTEREELLDKLVLRLKECCVESILHSLQSFLQDTKV